WLEDNIGPLLQREHDALTYAIEHSCRNKAAVVASDEREQGLRAILNLGHTFGHAIETHTGYRNWLHGEAVAVGMVMAAEFSQRCGWINAEEVMRVRNLIEAAGLPVAPPADMNADIFLQHMQRDKKTKNGRIRLVLLQSLGNAVITADYSAESLRDFLDTPPAAA
ncbi:MAG TPA: 3-dehydroquinate synthase, partial [Gammaproteobacteria bacterium]